MDSASNSDISKSPGSTRTTSGNAQMGVSFAEGSEERNVRGPGVTGGG